jgi:hypothetical protein
MQVAQGNPESDRGQVYGTGYGAAEQQVASARVAGQGIARNAMGSMNGFSERQEQPKVVSMGGSFGRRSAQGNLTETPEPVRPVAQGSGELHLDEDDPLFADLNLGGDDEELRFNIYDEPEEEEDDDLDFLNSLMSGQVYGE